MRDLFQSLSRNPESRRGIVIIAAVALASVCGLLFYQVFVPGIVLFSNDGPIGGLIAAYPRVPAWFTGGWQDLNWLGANIGVRDVSISSLLLLVLGPVGFAKFFAAVAIFLLGLGAAYAFRRLGLAPWACVVGSLAAALTSDFFSTSAWGLGSQCICFGLNFAALGLLANAHDRGRWLRVVLAGLAVGMGVIEAADIGALFSLLIAAYVVYQAWTEEGAPVRRMGTGFVRLAVVAGFAAFIAFNAVTGLVGTQIKGVAGTEQDVQTKEQRWDWATQWSLPKKEALGVVVPGLFGYRMDTPEGGQYWGTVGQTPGWEQHHQGFPRYAGSGYYAGVSVVLIALWAALQALRRKDSVFAPHQRKLLWFWSAMVVVSLLLAFGRHAPFYQFLYALPYFSTIRNPTKFMHLFSMAIVILCAYGIDGLWRKYVEVPVVAAGRSGSGTKNWRARLGLFDRRWVRGCGVVLGAGILGWLIYASSRVSLVRHLESVGFDLAMAQSIAGFSIRQVGWFVLFFLLTGGLLAMILGGVFAGGRAKWAGVLLGVVVVADLGRANLPWIVYWDYQYKYASNPVIDFLRDEPHKHRVAGLPFRAPPQFSLGEQMYRIEWMQHHFQYYNIQSLDIVQMSREPVDLKAFEGALQFKGTPDTLHLLTRRWQLTNTRYLLGPAGFLEVLNTQVDPEAQRFQYALRFDLGPKPGVVNAAQLSDITAVANTNGDYAIFEFTGALPRVKLYSNWQVSTNDQATLEKLASPDFNPKETVLVASEVPGTPSTNAPGTVEFSSYAPKHLVLKADAEAPAVLLLNDRYDPNWVVTVDGEPAPLLRCNYIMRGVYLAPGEHKVEFHFRPSVKALYVTLTAMAVGVVLLIVLVATSVIGRRRQRANDPA